jgi:hypothetical protein
MYTYVVFESKHGDELKTTYAGPNGKAACSRAKIRDFHSYEKYAYVEVWSHGELTQTISAADIGEEVEDLSELVE